MKNKENLTKSYIYTAFLQLLQEKPYDKISVCEVTEKAGVSRMSFYRNFNSKEDVIISGIDQITKNMKKRIKENDTITIYIITKEIFEEAKKYTNVFSSFLDSTVSKQLMITTLNELRENIAVDYMNKTSKYIPLFYFGAISTTLFEWLKNGAKEPSEEMAKMIAKLINFEYQQN